MKLDGKVVVVTGGASGIGEALCKRFAAESPKVIVVVDFNGEGATRVANEMGGVAMQADVGKEEDIIRVVKDTESEYGTIDLFVSNAGISYADKTHAASCTNDEWEHIWHVNTMAHVYAARACLPQMIERGSGYFVNTSSAAGLLSQIGSATYSVTKHAAVGFAESLAITHGDDGINVSVLCPQAVRTAMLKGGDGGVAGQDGLAEPEDVANTVLEAIEEERFLILPHTEVLTYMQRKTSDYQRWIGGMRRFRKRMIEARAK